MSLLANDVDIGWSFIQRQISEMTLAAVDLKYSVEEGICQAIKHKAATYLYFALGKFKHKTQPMATTYTYCFSIFL